jgi:hypothetical protein
MALVTYVSNQQVVGDWRRRTGARIEEQVGEIEKRIADLAAEAGSLLKKKNSVMLQC